MKKTTCAFATRARRFLPLFVLFLWSTPLAAQQDGDFTYSSNLEDASSTVTGYTGPGGAVAIPDTLGGLPVRAIASEVFRDNLSLTGVTIPGGVSSIGSGAFSGCSGLSGITIPDSVTALGAYSFERCTGLTSVNIGSGLTSISEDTFYGCTHLMSLTFGRNVTVIGSSAFEGCADLAGVTIPDSVTVIGEDAFERCTGLVNVIIGNHVAAIGKDAFNGCASLSRVTFAGDAPASLGVRIFNGAAPGFTIYYFEGSSGFPLPPWLVYPVIALPPLRVQSLTRQGGTVSLAVTGGLVGWTYKMQRSPDLILGPWTTVRTLNPLIAAGPLELTDPAPPPARAFYRVEGTAP